MALRVEGGEARGRSLRVPRGIRPTSGLTKGAIFNLLGPAVQGAAVVDLFAGSGGLGIEALSRGAAGATFVERSRACASILRQNLLELGYVDRARIIVTDAIRWLSGPPRELEAVGLVLADPPYQAELLGDLLGRLERAVTGPATIVVEHAARDRLPALDRFRVVTERRYGDSAVAVLEVPWR
jgi:16S rRNA (guanine966-N2)-methyltransferase